MRINAVTSSLRQPLVNWSWSKPPKYFSPHSTKRDVQDPSHVQGLGVMGQERVEDSYKPYVFLSHLQIPGLVSSEFSNSILHFASSVHGVTQHCVAPMEFKAVHPSNPGHSRLKLYVGQDLEEGLGSMGWRLAGTPITWQPAASANTLNPNQWYPHSR